MLSTCGLRRGETKTPSHFRYIVGERLGHADKVESIDFKGGVAVHEASLEVHISPMLQKSKFRNGQVIQIISGFRCSIFGRSSVAVEAPICDLEKFAAH